ncbi:hypothetical protein GTGU_00424 [Trabulsiella guamensis ATCC 49490]|uniref:Uncharacterized protein n=1 Tax=Trabulsiella guamensis ATCC 49490 TaxID=1005994 RepID=A0A085AMZ3_9ENTR|nr:hypothetical protein [Trabulsiella guamensis]KFC11588.1 hypothetical protein GTGU_00424 [Trabulsiella guamensis ATCC 49490]
MTTVLLPPGLKILFPGHTYQSIVICFICLMIPHYGQAEEYLKILRYAYGKSRSINFEKQQPKHYQLQLRNDYRINKIGYTYTLQRISQPESVKNQRVNSINLSLTIEHSSQDILAKINIINNSQKDYYIPLRTSPTDELPAQMCGDMFQITSENTILDYHGYKCRFDTDGSKDSWQLIPAKRRYSYTVPLNHFYFFMPGKHHYSISTLEYTVVDDDWFAALERNALLLSILDAPGPFPRQDSLETFLERFSYFGLKPGFDIRSRTVSIEIDGDNLQ